MPHLLAIETSNPSSSSSGVAGSIALARLAPFSILATETVAAATHAHDDLLPAIDRCVHSSGIDRRQIARVAVSVGPGGFTSVRVACAAGKMIAEGLSAACASVPSALVAFADPHRARAAAGQTTAIAMASKAGTAWVAALPECDAAKITTDHADLASRGTIMTADQLIALQPALVLSDGHLDKALQAALAASAVPTAPMHLHASALASVAHVLPDVDPALLVPIYPREPEAVTLWRQRHGR